MGLFAEASLSVFGFFCFYEYNTLIRDLLKYYRRVGIDNHLAQGIILPNRLLGIHRNITE